MYHKITQEMSDEYCHVMDEDISVHCSNPRKETLALIMQFARVYYVEKELPAGMSGIILN